MNQIPNLLEPRNGHNPTETALVEPRANVTAISPSGEWRDALPMNSSGKYAVEESGGLDFAQIMSIGRRRWKLMLGVLLFCIVGSILVVLRANPVYQSIATLELTSSGKSSFDTSAIPGLGQFASDGQGRNMDTQIEIIKGDPIAKGALTRIKPELQPALKNVVIDADQRGDSSLVDITVNANDPQAAADYANAISDEYVSNSLEKNKDSSRGALDYVKDQLTGPNGAIARVARAQNALSLYKKRTGIISLSEQASAFTSALAAKRSTLDSTTTQRAATEAQLRNQQAQLAGIPVDKLVATGLSKNPIVSNLQSQLTSLQIERSAALQEYTPTSYKVQQIDTQIASVKGQLSKQAQNEVTSLQPDPRRAPLVQSIAGLQSQIWAADATINGLNQQIAQAQSFVNQLPDQEIQFSQLQNNVTLETDNFQRLRKSQQDLNLTVNSQTADGTPVFKAEPNTNPIAPDKKRIVLTGLVLGIMGALALAMLVDAFDNRIYTEDEAQQATHLPVLAQIPFIKQADKQSLYLTGDRVSPLLESNRMLRANISFCATDKPVKAIVVTSSVPNEGKSSSALNLAVAAALSGESVILVDLDLRRPTQHVLTGLPNTSGFTNVIAGQLGIVAALQDTPIPNLRVMTSGPTPPNPYRMLNSQTAKSTIQKILSMADFVVIDTPPILGLADARLISSLVDGTLMVISCQETGRREAARSAELMASANQEVLGTVLTKVPNSSGAGSYQTYARYGRYFDEDQRTAERMDESMLAGKLDAAPSDKEK